MLTTVIVVVLPAAHLPLPATASPGRSAILVLTSVLAGAVLCVPGHGVLQRDEATQQLWLLSFGSVSS